MQELHAPHFPMAQLEAGLDHVTQSPQQAGTLDMIVRRPDIDSREEIEQGHLDLQIGLVGDNWALRTGTVQAPKVPSPDRQLTVMNSRAVQLISGERSRWALAGDQLYVDFDLSESHLPPGSRLQIGQAIIEITPPPHNGCNKFVQRYGKDAVLFVNSPTGKDLHLRGLNAKVVHPGPIRKGDTVNKL